MIMRMMMTMVVQMMFLHDSLSSLPSGHSFIWRRESKSLFLLSPICTSLVRMVSSWSWFPHSLLSFTTRELQMIKHSCDIKRDSRDFASVCWTNDVCLTFPFSLISVKKWSINWVALMNAMTKEQEQRDSRLDRLMMMTTIKMMVSCHRFNKKCKNKYLRNFEQSFCLQVL